IRLFPRSWRERYADEFEALLDELPGGPRSTVDVVAAAARAHASVSADSVRRVGDQLGGAEAQRAGAAAAIVGGSLWVLTFGVGSLVQWGRYGRDWGFVLLIVAAALVLGAQVVSGTAWQGRGRVVVRV